MEQIKSKQKDIKRFFILLLSIAIFSITWLSISTPLRAATVNPVANIRVENNPTGGPSSFNLYVDWALEDGTYSTGDTFKITLKTEGAKFPHSLIGKSVDMLDSESIPAGKVTISDDVTLVAVFNDYVSGKSGIKGMIQTEISRTGIPFQEEIPFDVQVNEEPVKTYGQLKGRTGIGADYTIIKGPGPSRDALSEDQTTISWYAMINFNGAAAKNIVYQDMPGKGHQFDPSSLRVYEAVYEADKLYPLSQKLLTADSYNLETIYDASNIARGFKISFNNLEPKSYYVSYKTIIIDAELNINDLEIDENGKPIFKNGGTMTYLDDSDQPKENVDNKTFTAINFLATIEGYNDPDTSTTTTTSSPTTESTTTSVTPTTTTSPTTTKTTTSEITTTPTTPTETITVSKTNNTDQSKSTSSSSETTLVKTGESKLFTMLSLLLILIAITFAGLRLKQKQSN